MLDFTANGTRSSAAVWLTALVVMLSCCAPSPRNPLCRTNSMCEAEHADQPHCVNGHCVECLSNRTCGDGKTCFDGACIDKQ